MEWILASQSPRRRELMGLFGRPFRVQAAQVDETLDPKLTPERAVALLSEKKARAVEARPGDVVIGADTVVVLEDRILGKPADEAQAMRMLTALSGREHRVMTGVTVLRDGKALSHTEITRIRFRPLSPAEIRRYIATGEPMDKAGAYGIQGGAALFAEYMEGDYYNVMGLPVCRLGQMLRQLAPEGMEDEE